MKNQDILMLFPRYCPKWESALALWSWRTHCKCFSLSRELRASEIQVPLYQLSLLVLKCEMWTVIWNSTCLYRYHVSTGIRMMVSVQGLALRASTRKRKEKVISTELRKYIRYVWRDWHWFTSHGKAQLRRNIVLLWVSLTSYLSHKHYHLHEDEQLKREQCAGNFLATSNRLTANLLLPTHKNKLCDCVLPNQGMIQL